MLAVQRHKYTNSCKLFCMWNFAPVESRNTRITLA